MKHIKGLLGNVDHSRRRFIKTLATTATGLILPTQTLKAAGKLLATGNQSLLTGVTAFVKV